MAKWNEEEVRAKVLAAQRGDADALDDLVAVWYSIATAKFDRRRNRNLIGELEDAAQDAVIDCLKALPKYDPELGTCKAFFGCVVHHAFSVRIRKPMRVYRRVGLVLSLNDLPAGVSHEERDNRLAILHMRGAHKSRSLHAPEVEEIRRLLSEVGDCAKVARMVGRHTRTVQRVRKNSITTPSTPETK